MTPPKKKAKSKVKIPKTTAFTVTVTGDEAQYFVSVLKKAELKKLRGRGLESDAGLMTLSQTLSGDEETTWISPSSVSVYVNDKEIPVHYHKDVTPQWVKDHRKRDVAFVEQTIDNATYTAEVLANSPDDIRAEMSLSEQWILPDGREIYIYMLSVVCLSEVDLEFAKDGGGGLISGELITADGKSVGLDEEEDEGTGEYRVTV